MHSSLGGAFEHFEIGLQPCILESWRVLKPGGYLFITVPYYNLRHLWRELSWSKTNNTNDFAQHTNGEHQPPTSFRFYQWRLTRNELEWELAIGRFKVLDTVPVQVLEGIRRTLEIDLKLKANTASYRIGMRLLRRLMPANWVAHMIMAVAQKPLSVDK